MNEPRKFPSSLERGIVAVACGGAISATIWLIVQNSRLQAAFILGGLLLAIECVIGVAGWKHGLRWLFNLRVASFFILFAVIAASVIVLGRAHGRGDVFVLALLSLCLEIAAIAVALKRGWRFPFSRSVLRFAFWFCAGLISVIVLFYMEEGWRGKRAWAALEREAAARGESLDISSLRKPAVPDELNFVAAPGISNLLGMVSVNPPPKSRLDFTAEWHQHGPSASWTRQQFTDMKAWHRFLQQELVTNTASHEPVQPLRGRTVPGQAAVGLAPTQSPVSEPSQSPAAAVLFALKRFQPDLDLLREASRRPEARFPIDFTRGFYMNKNIWTWFNRLRNATLLLAVRASAELELGQTDAALQDVLLAVRLTRIVSDAPPPVLPRGDMLLYCLQPVWEGTAAHRWRESQLAALEKAFSSMNPAKDCPRYFRAEVLFLMNLVDQSLAFATGGQSALAERLRDSNDHLSTSERWVSRLVRIAYPVGWFYQDKVCIYRFYQSSLPLFQAGGPGDAVSHRQTFSTFRAADPAFAILLLPRLRQFREEIVPGAFFFQTILREEETACALEQYRWVHGDYPDSLAALVPGYFKELPRDLLARNGASLRYRHTGSGFVLYSLGWNRVDDGGNPGPRDPYSAAFPDLNQGDWVWSVPEPQ